MFPVVKFNSMEEFLEEMKRDKDKIDRGIVRITNVYKGSRVAPNIEVLTFVAAFTIRDRVTRLDVYCGDLWRINQDQDEKVFARAKQLEDEVRKVIQELGLDLRNGIFEM